MFERFFSIEVLGLNYKNINILYIDINPTAKTEYHIHATIFKIDGNVIIYTQRNINIIV